MTSSYTRKVDDAFPGEEENESRQRRRIEEQVEGAPAASASIRSLSLMDLNDNVLVNILSFLTFSVLNEVAICNERCREIRSHESLDQTRVGTIVCTDNTTPESFYRASQEHDWNEVFSGNRTHLKVIGLEKVQGRNWRYARREARADIELAGVLKLDVSCASQEEPIGRGEVALDVPLCSLEALLFALPSLREMNASYLKLDGSLDYFRRAISTNLERLTWAGCNGSVYFDGNRLSHCLHLTELILNDYHVNFGGDRDDFVRLYSEPINAMHTVHMWMYCRRLERLSMKNATFSCKDMSAPEPITQEMLINMVRRHRSLRWLRSDLTEENVAMLKHERPDITFVME